VKQKQSNMNKLIATNKNNWTALIARLALGVTLFPHGAQKLLGWFGGYGFTGTIGFLTGQAHLPYIVALLVILIESVGAVLLIAGLFTRLAAFGVIVNFIGVVATSIINNGFFMNWYMEPNKGEGLEYFILLFGLAFISLIAGGGKWSIDGAIIKTSSVKKETSSYAYQAA
jgi:putative oxidoreductase